MSTLRPISEHRAVVVGVTAYQAPQRLANATHDAAAVAELLSREFPFDLEPAGEALLDDAATHANLTATLTESLRTASANTRWLFYFAGHGGIHHGQAYLLPADATESPASWIDLRWLIDLCVASPCSETLLILDACYAGEALVQPESLTDDLDPQGLHSTGIHQVLTAGGPRQAVLDAGSKGHSVFTQGLLDALEGWAGVHGDNGEVSLTRLRDYLREEIPKRLGEKERDGRESRSDVQRVVAGNLAPSPWQQDFRFLPLIARPAADTLRLLRSAEPIEKRQGLARLAHECRSKPTMLPLATRLIFEALPETGKRGAERPQEKGAENEQVRCRALETLGTLLEIADLPQGWPTLAPRLCWRALRAACLEPSAAVRRAARRAVARSSPCRQKHLARHLATLGQRGSRNTRRRLDALLAVLPEARRELSWPWRLRALLIRGALGSATGWRWLTATPLRRRIAAAPFTAFGVLYLSLLLTYYPSLDAASAVVLRRGHPGFTILPAVGNVAVETDFTARDFPEPELLRRERLLGTWLALDLDSGTLTWGERLAKRLPAASAGLTLWRLGETEAAWERLRQGVMAGDGTCLEVAGYLTLVSADTGAPKLAAIRNALSWRPDQPETALDIFMSLRGLGRQATRNFGVRPRAETEREPGSRSAPPALDASLSAVSQELRPMELTELALRGKSLEDRLEALRRLAGTAANLPRNELLGPLRTLTRDASSEIRAAALLHWTDLALVRKDLQDELVLTLPLALEDPAPWARRRAAEAVLLLADHFVPEPSQASQLPAPVSRALELWQGDLTSTEEMATAVNAGKLASEYSRAAPRAAEILARQLAAELPSADVFLGDKLLRFLGDLGRHQTAILPELATFLVEAAAVASGRPEADEDLIALVFNTLRGWRQLPAERIEATVEKFLAQLEVPSPLTRAAAARGLAALASGTDRNAARAAEALTLVLADPVPSVRSAAAGALGQLGQAREAAAGRATETLTECLNRGPEDLRADCAEALAAILEEYPPSKPARARALASALVTALDAPQPRLRMACASALLHLAHHSRPTVRSAVAPLQTALERETDPELRLALAAAMGAAAGDQPAVVRQAIAVVSSALENPEPGRSAMALWTLRDIGEASPELAPETVEILAKRLEDPTFEHRRWLIFALRDIGLAQRAVSANVLRRFGSALATSATSLHWDVIANGIAPFPRRHPQTAALAAKILRRFLAGGPRTPADSAAFEAFVEVMALSSAAEPRHALDLLASPRRFERRAGEEALLRLADQHPERIHVLQEDLLHRRSSIRPQECLAASRASEMLTLLQTTCKVAHHPDDQAVWREVLAAVRKWGVASAVDMCMNLLSEGVSTQPR